jgi:hypothetical protein
MQIGENKLHSFDLATEVRDIVVECKAFTFTVTGGNPSAKITTLREAVQYLRSLSGSPARLLVVKRDVHPVRGESLAEYFVRLNSYLLGDVKVLEMDADGGPVRYVHGATNQDGNA